MSGFGPTFLPHYEIKPSITNESEALDRSQASVTLLLTIHVADLKISDFNPYSSYYVAHPLLDGACYYTTTSSIDDRYLKSQNKLEIRKIIVGRKEKKATAADLPIRLAVALLRDVDTKYRLGPIIWQMFKNLILKAVAAPGKLLGQALRWVSNF